MTELDASETPDTGSDSSSVHWAVVALLVLVVFIAGSASLMMSFHGLRDLVERVEDVHGWLSDVGPVGIDGLQLASLFAIIMTATAPIRVRAYLWLVFLGSIALSVVGNCVDAAARHAGGAGVVLSGVWPALLAAATHVVVMAVRWWQSSRPEPKPSPLERDIVAEVRADLARAIPAAPASADLVEPSAKSAAQLRAIARSRYQNNSSCRQVAIDMTTRGWSVSEKQVERWTKDLRAPVQASDIEPVTVPA
jgi:hypothetical protein